MEKETIYDNNPLDQAMWFVDQGAEWLHIVDLDGAVSGKNINIKAIEQILNKLKDQVKIQIGGGIRSKKRVEELFEYGIQRVILGTIAIEKPLLVEELAKNQ